MLDALSNGGRPGARGWRLKLPAGSGTRANEPLWGRVSEEAPELSGSAARDQTGPPCAGTDSLRAAAPMSIMSSVPSCSRGIYESAVFLRMCSAARGFCTIALAMRSQKSVSSCRAGRHTGRDLQRAQQQQLS